ncbi:hypothetical protein [Desulfovibrio sp. ZJ369]|uniref:hypothetical protein n=1 Tax=Desulfovibrio sp. ZJ369 TaxID=2709793 RepID=UPI00197EEC1B|nr:hypothetical protein [Desulfovibrio sp. ZJ369]
MMRKYTLFFLVLLAALGLCGAHVASGMGSDAGKNTEAGAAHRPEPLSGALPPDAAQPPVQPPDVQSQYTNSNVYNSTTTVYTTAGGYSGFAGTWRDPESGDIITSVIAPRPPQQPDWDSPLIVAPQVYPGCNNQSNPPGPPPRPHPYPPGPPPRPYPGPGSVPPWQQPGWQNPRPPQGQMPPGWRPPANTQPWPHAPGWRPRPHNGIPPSGNGAPGMPGARR